ncbi:ABC transporter permease [Cohnella sp. GCM10027633]|uniref:ABC transporter permease n=1 Tax=unclassified Cohnella TaxID=2636738 RepID=UPI003635EB5C
MHKAIEASAPARSAGRNGWRSLRKNSFGYMLMLPSVALTFIFAYLPMPGIIAAFKDYNMFVGLWGSPWAGMEHIREIFETPMLRQAIYNTLELSVLTILVGFPAPIILALMINEVKDGLFKRSVQTLSYLPHFLSWIAVVGLAYSFFDQYGPLNDLKLMLSGGEGERIMFLSKQELFLPVLLLLSVWKEVGWGTIVYLAAITTIDPSLYEAAKIDGANRWKQHRYITLPGLKMTAILLLIFTLGTLFASNFELVYGMQNAFISYDVISTVVYSSGIQQGDYSMAAAVGFLQGLVALALTVGANSIAKRTSGISIW